jgi:hypothetical protein
MKASRGTPLALIVLLGLAYAAHVCQAKHFTVRVSDPSKLEQVRAHFTQFSASDYGSGTA